MKIAIFDVNGINGRLAVLLPLDVLETKRRPAWLPGGAGRIAELFLQSRQRNVALVSRNSRNNQLHPVVLPQVLHFRQAPSTSEPRRAGRTPGNWNWRSASSNRYPRT
ncbi:hypothetical protein [Bosea vaviloviae]|uniref:hypothetical protein n=1 Tax=Bosea vaviloviae TaxID=1526658 RepID=UPI0011E001E6|nr:hypothetical protein [Bosea vaviloviae]